MKNQNTIKRITQKLFFVALILLLLPCLAFGASTSLPDTKVKATAKSLKDAKVQKRPLQKQGSTLLNPQNTKPVLRSAEITNLRIGTEPSSGIWFWEATVKNTGDVELEWQRVRAQGYKVSFPQAQNAWTLASGKLIGPPNLAPNQSRVIKVHWKRCCMTDQLKVVLQDHITHKVWDNRTLKSLVYSPPQHKPLNVRVKRIEWNDTIKKWKTTLKNFSNYTVKVAVNGTLLVANTTTPIPAGGHEITLGPNGEASTMWLHVNAQHGDKLIMHKIYRMGDNNCNESNNDCGYFQDLIDITIPNSHTFF